MKTTSFLAFGGSLGLLVLLGLGCQPNQPSIQPTNAPTNAPVVTPPSTPPVASTASSTVTLPTIDETWQTYTSKTLGFSFQWPTKGKYAPKWEVTLIRAGGAGIDANGCINYGGEEFATFTAPNGVSFCHSYLNSADAEKSHLVDHYATKIGNQYAVIALTKDYATDLKPAFDKEAYRAFLDQIVSTFKNQ